MPSVSHAETFGRISKLFNNSSLREKPVYARALTRFVCSSRMWHNTASPHRSDLSRCRTKNFFLRTKLLPPRAVSELLDRPRLTKKLASTI